MGGGEGGRVMGEGVHVGEDVENEQEDDDEGEKKVGVGVERS